MKRIIIVAGIIGLITLCYKKLFVVAMIVGGFFVAPEASHILSHYCFGDGDTLYLDSSYLKTSPVVISAAKGLNVGGKITEVRLNQSDDWRLSYAINGFTLKRTKKGYMIQQWIEFDKTGKIPTNINFGICKLRVQDAIVHTFDCTPFWVICEFKSLK
jgi:hypothetical protein